MYGETPPPPPSMKSNYGRQELVRPLSSGFFILLTLIGHLGTAATLPEWKSHFIWTHQWGEDPPLYDPENLFVMFRKSFELPNSPARARASVFCDGRYKLFVNGRYIGRGPVRHEGYRYYYDEYDLAAHLNAGKNVVAVLVRTFGENGTGWYFPAPESAVRGALIFEASLELIGGRRMSLSSDPSWKFRRAEAWAQNTPRPNGNLPNMELYDANLEMEHWVDVDFDDTAWRNAVLVSSDQGKTSPPMEPYIFLLPRPIPHLKEEVVWPVETAGFGETPHSVFSVRRPESLSELAQRTRVEPHYPARAFEFRNLNDLVGPAASGFTIERTLESDNIDPAGYVIPQHLPFVIVDFGREVVGYLQLEIDSAADVTIDLAFGETLIDGRVDATEPSGNYVARYITKKGKQSWERFDWLGFRYLQLTFRNLRASIRVKPSLNFVTYPISGRGRFNSSDSLLNKIWEIAKYTLQTNTWDTFMDLPNREQRQWIGDGELNVLTHYAANGDLPVVQKLLDDMAHTQRSDGLLRKYASGRNNPGKNTELILDYNFSWTRTLADYYLYTGDLERVRRLYPTLVKNLDWFQVFAGEDGLLGSPPARLFLDFSAPDYRGKSAGYNLHYFGTLKRAAFLARAVADPYHERVWEEAADRILESFDEHFWDTNKGLYVDAWQHGEKSIHVGQVTNGLALFYGVIPDDRVSSVLEKILDPTRLREWSGHGRLTDPPPRPPGFDPDREIMKAQPYGAFFLLRGLARVGRYNLVLNQIRESWGKWIEQGAQTFWGNWDRNNSLDAAWGSSPMYILATDVLGVRPLEPGFTLFAVEPHPCDLEWAEGSFPSVVGDIPVSWRIGSQTFELDMTVLEKSQAQVLIPNLGPRRPTTVRVNGTIVWQEGTTTVSDFSAVPEEAGIRVQLDTIGPYKFLASY